MFGVMLFSHVLPTSMCLSLAAARRWAYFMHPDSLSMCRLGEGVALPPEGGCSGCTALAIDHLHLRARYIISCSIKDLAENCPHECCAALTRRMCSSSVPAPGSASASCLLTAKCKKASPILRGIGW